MPRTRQRVHQRSMHPGPLVLGMRPIKFRTPTADKDQQLMLLCTLPFPLQIVLYGDLIFLLNSVHHYIFKCIFPAVHLVPDNYRGENSIVRRVVSTGSLSCYVAQGLPSVLPAFSTTGFHRFSQIYRQHGFPFTVSRRFEPSSRTTLICEQHNPWELLHPQDVMSRHRGAKPSRRCGLLERISLLSLE